ncbi:MAG TPA: flippase-like domain-containing protein [Planctomycetes bacterium]|nr:flippase-like domain-containing protein [Planctomycetota bacterium]
MTLSVAMAAGLLWLLISWSDVSAQDLWTRWRSLSLTVWAGALALHGGIYCLRSLRFGVLLSGEGQPGRGRLLAISAAHNLAALMLPAKTGEAALPLYLKRYCAVPISAGLASLVVSRLLDLALLCTILAGSSLWMSQSVDQAPAWMLPLSLALCAAAAFGFAVSARADWLLAIFDRASRILGLRGTRVGARLDDLSRKTAESLRTAGGSGRLWRATALSVPLWLGVFAFLGVLATGFGLEHAHGLPGDTFGAAWSLLAQMLPINVFAGAGTQELGWVVGFGLLGVPEDLALETGLGVYTVYRLNVLLLGVLGHLAMALFGKTPAEHPGA